MTNDSPLPHPFLTAENLPSRIRYLETLRCRTPTPPTDPEPTYAEALCCIQPDESICLVVSDHTRKTGVNRILPILLVELRDRGINTEDITVHLVALDDLRGWLARQPSIADMKLYAGVCLAGLAI